MLICSHSGILYHVCVILMNLVVICYKLVIFIEYIKVMDTKTIFVYIIYY